MPTAHVVVTLPTGVTYRVDLVPGHGAVVLIPANAAAVDEIDDAVYTSEPCS